MEKTEDVLENLMGRLGEFGRYQCLQYILHLVSTVAAGINIFSLVTIAGVPTHRCAINGVDTPNYTAPWNSSLVLNAIPMNSHGRLDSCHLYGDNMTLIRCHSWVYDDQYYTSSRGIEWDFVCQRRWMSALAQVSTTIGAVVGAGVLGRLCDKFGRKNIFLFAGILQLILGTIVAFINEYYTFVVIRFFYGIFGISAFKAGFVLTIELVGPSYRTFCGSLFEVGYAFGVMLLSLWAYLIDNRFYLQLVYALHAAILLPHLFIMDESPRWLWGQGRVDEAIAIIKKALKMNKLPDTIDAPLLLSEHKKKIKEFGEDAHAGTLDLFKSPNMMRRTVIICCCWFANSLVYFGLTLNSGSLRGNPFFILFLMGFVEVPGFLIAMFFVHRFGNRGLISIMMLLSGTCCLIVVVLHQWPIAVLTFVMLGKLIVSGTYSIVIKYSAEIFPTVARSSGVGLATMFSCLSGAVSPCILLLDTFNPNIPTIVFGFVTIASGLSVLILPETFGKTLPQSLEDGEKFGDGDTCFANCAGRKNSDGSVDIPEVEVPLKSVKSDTNEKEKDTTRS